MAEATKIQWCDHTFNPWRGCAKVAAGCANCYADAQSKRNPGVLGIWGDDGTRVVAAESQWRQVEKWNREAAVCRCEHKLDHLAIQQALGSDSAECSKCGLPFRPHDHHRPRVFVGSLMDWAEDWQGPMCDSKGEQLFWPDSVDLATDEENAGKPWVAQSCTAGDERPLTMSDVRARLFRTIDACPNLDFLLLTKRPENIRRFWAIPGMEDATPTAKKTWEPHAGRHRKNVWLITSIANQEDADRNLPHLLACRDLSTVLGVSAEPLVGPVDFTKLPICLDQTGGYQDALRGTWEECRGNGGYWFGDKPEDQVTGTCPSLDWVIVGGESGGKARPYNVEWARSIIRQCREAGVPCFHKQLGHRPYDWPGAVEPLEKDELAICLNDPKGGDIQEWAEDLRVREFPSGTE